jgi:hypothetical protein
MVGGVYAEWFGGYVKDCYEDGSEDVLEDILKDGLGNILLMGLVVAWLAG